MLTQFFPGAAVSDSYSFFKPHKTLQTLFLLGVASTRMQAYWNRQRAIEELKRDIVAFSCHKSTKHTIITIPRWLVNVMQVLQHRAADSVAVLQGGAHC